MIDANVRVLKSVLQAPEGHALLLAALRAYWRGDGHLRPFFIWPEADIPFAVIAKGICDALKSSEEELRFDDVLVATLRASMTDWSWRAPPERLDDALALAEALGTWQWWGEEENRGGHGLRQPLAGLIEVPDRAEIYETLCASLANVDPDLNHFSSAKRYGNACHSLFQGHPERWRAAMVPGEGARSLATKVDQLFRSKWVDLPSSDSTRVGCFPWAVANLVFTLDDVEVGSGGISAWRYHALWEKFFGKGVCAPEHRGNIYLHDIRSMVEEIKECFRGTDFDKIHDIVKNSTGTPMSQLQHPRELQCKIDVQSANRANG